MKLYLYCLLVYLAAMLIMIGLCDVVKVFADGIRETRALRKAEQTLKKIRGELEKR